MLKEFIGEHRKAVFYTAAIVPFVFVSVLFFLYPVYFTWDAAHYMAFLPILDGSAGMEAWDVVRGPTFPVLLWLVTRIFGETMHALLAVHYIVFTSTLCLYYLIVASVLPLSGYKRKLGAIYFIYIFAALNPLVFSYYHLVLTEYLASFFAALTVFAAIKYYQLMLMLPVGDCDSEAAMTRVWVKYRICQIVLVLSCPIIYFLRQNYLMLVVAAGLAVILLTLIQRRGWKKTLRASGLGVCALAALAVSIFAWNAVLPEIETDEYVLTSDRVFAYVIVPETQYINYTDDPDGMIVSFHDGKGGLVDSYIVGHITDKYDLTVSDSISILLRNITSHPVLVLRGIVDSYLAASNFYESYDGTGFAIMKQPSMTRATENLFLGYVSFSPEMVSNMHSMTPELYETVRAYESSRAAGSVFNRVFTMLSVPANFTFTLGFLLLPFCWIGALILVIVYKHGRAFILSFIASSMSLGYVLLNNLGMMIIDRYSFPVYITAWLAILSLLYGILKKLRVKN